MLIKFHKDTYVFKEIKESFDGSHYMKCEQIKVGTIRIVSLNQSDEPGKSDILVCDRRRASGGFIKFINVPNESFEIVEY